MYLAPQGMGRALTPIVLTAGTTEAWRQEVPQ